MDINKDTKKLWQKNLNRYEHCKKIQNDKKRKIKKENACMYILFASFLFRNTCKESKKKTNLKVLFLI